ncbi:MAG: hypothetical protein JXB26_20550 [Candidatus Aminicenantes bacterium]|nr:hypothetical protein [Candidatus Aminicenantes bacterium]
MTRRCEKIINGWKENIPVEVSFNDVKIVAENFFDRFEKPRRGSHYTIYDHRLEMICKKYPEFCEFGRLGVITIPVIKGRKVKKIWVKNIIEAIDLISNFPKDRY